MYFHSTVLGVVNFAYDSKNKTVKASRKLFWYRILYFAMVTIALILLIYLSAKRSRRWSVAAGENQILFFVKAFNGLVFLVALAYSFLYHLTSSNKFVNLISAIVSTNYGFFDKFTSEKEQRRVFFYFLLKYLTSLYFIFLNIVIYSINESGWISILMFIAYTSILNVLQCTMTLVFVSIVVSTKFYKILRNQLRELLEDISRSRKMCYLKDLNQKIDDISIMYSRVYCIQTYAFDIHQIPIWSILLTNYISSIVRAYQFYCYLFIPKLKYLKLFMASTTLFAFSFDMFFFLNVCDENVEAWKDSRKLLRSFCYNGVDEHLQRNVSIF